MPARRPIGVFDSGVGGLSVLREIRRALPADDLLYVADSGHAPYGDRDDAFIAARVQAIAAFFRSAGVKAVVVACNTATAVAVQTLSSQFSVPVVAIEPAIKPAVQRTRSGVVGVLATRSTVASAALARLVQAHGQGVRVLLQACPGWVEQVERGELTGARTHALVERDVGPLVAQGADMLVLGCTHYPLLRDAIARAAGPAVELLDPAPAVARELARRVLPATLSEAQLDPTRPDAPPADRPGAESFWTSGSSVRVARTISMLWGRPTQVLPLPVP
jgi:glutamate racemase